MVVYEDKHIGKDLLPTVFMLMSLESSGVIERAGRFLCILRRHHVFLEVDPNVWASLSSLNLLQDTLVMPRLTGVSGTPGLSGKFL